MNWVQEHLEQVSREEKPDYQLFVSIYICTAIANWVFAGFEIIGCIFWTVKSAGGDVNETAFLSVWFKFSLFLMIVIVTFLSACCIIKCVTVLVTKKRSEEERTQTKTLCRLVQDFDLLVPEGLQIAALVFVFLCCYTGKRKSIITLLLIVWNFLSFALIITWCLISCIIIVFITPIQTLAIVFLLLSIFLFVYIAVAAVGLLVLQKGPSQNKMSRCTCNRVLNTIIICTIGITFLFLISFYLYLVRIGIKTGGIGGIAISLIPGALTAAMALFSRKLLKKYQIMRMSRPRDARPRDAPRRTSETTSDSDLDPLVITPV